MIFDEPFKPNEILSVLSKKKDVQKIFTDISWGKPIRETMIEKGFKLNENAGSKSLDEITIKLTIIVFKIKIRKESFAEPRQSHEVFDWDKYLLEDAAWMKEDDIIGLQIMAMPKKDKKILFEAIPEEDDLPFQTTHRRPVAEPKGGNILHFIPTQRLRNSLQEGHAWGSAPESLVLSTGISGIKPRVSDWQMRNRFNEQVRFPKAYYRGPRDAKGIKPTIVPVCFVFCYRIQPHFRSASHQRQDPVPTKNQELFAPDQSDPNLMSADKHLTKDRCERNLSLTRSSDKKSMI